MAQTQHGSNLFAIDHSVIIATLTEANSALLKRRDALTAAMARCRRS
jgi:hypothetical protein